LEGYHKDAYPSDKLSQREIDTLALVLVGNTLRAVAAIQGVTLGTIKKRWQLVKDKLGIEGRTQSFRETLLEWYEALNRHTLQYIEQTIELQVALPFEFMDSWQQFQNAVNQQVRRLSGKPPNTPKRELIRKSRQTASKPIQQQLGFNGTKVAKLTAQATIDTELRLLFDALMASLDIENPEQCDTLWSSFIGGLIHYLLQSIRPQSAGCLSRSSSLCPYSLFSPATTVLFDLSPTV
jgi:DNA-binding CsgD family transcriptional regulator